MKQSLLGINLIIKLHSFVTNQDLFTVYMQMDKIHNSPHSSDNSSSETEAKRSAILFLACSAGGFGGFHLSSVKLPFWICWRLGEDWGENVGGGGGNVSSSLPLAW